MSRLEAVARKVHSCDSFDVFLKVGLMAFPKVIGRPAIYCLCARLGGLFSANHRLIRHGEDIQRAVRMKIRRAFVCLAVKHASESYIAVLHNEINGLGHSNSMA